MLFKNKNKTPMPVLVETDKKEEYTRGPGITLQVNNHSPKSAHEDCIKDKKAIVSKYLDALLNGTEISQLSINDQVTDFAKKALLELQELTMNDNVINAKEELESIRANYEEIKEQIDKMRPLYEELLANQASLASEIDELTKQRDGLVKSINGDISSLRESRERELEEDIEKLRNDGYAKVKEDINEKINAKQQELTALEETVKQFEDTFNNLKENYSNIQKSIQSALKEECEVEWVQIAEGNGIYAVEGYKLSAYVNELIGTYSRKMNVSKEEARDEFVANSPELFAIIGRLENNSNRFNTIKWLTINSTSLRNAVGNIKVPVYKDNGNRKSLPKEVVSNIKLIQRETELENMALEEKAKRIIAEKRLEKIMNILLPYMPNDIDLGELLANDDNDTLDWIKR